VMPVVGWTCQYIVNTLLEIAIFKTNFIKG
jgi:hypothetical protein